MGPRAFRVARRRGRRRGLIVGAAVGAAAARGSNNSGSNGYPQQDELASELEQLASLRDKGILTEEEFQAKKEELLES